VHNNTDFLLASTDIVATDTVTTTLMGLNPRKIITIRLGYEAGLGEMHIEKIEIVGEDLKNLRMNFEQHEDYLQRAFPSLTLAAKSACSGCLIPLFSALHRIELAGKNLNEEITVALGKDLARIKTDRALFIGECAKKIAEEQCFLSGCPPTKEEMFEFLREHL
jgi:hypothetical protein